VLGGWQRRFSFETASTVRQALDAAHGAGLPQQNLIAVDREGHLGWTIMGQVPRRSGLDGLPHSWADGSRGGGILQSSQGGPEH
jgi:penicillin G amidase